MYLPQLLAISNAFGAASELFLNHNKAMNVALTPRWAKP
ncbi:hypothetical protein PI124_g19361 [Phytophthora idaei]|nr:hypothetical protein PI125_g20987 [Phytophthora idaei]KAG3133116.1 hypothetical protein PI126_g19312 [Phytophthora idaei]KAG3235609.1 hypothetical protein PI124_g19361 [Phytophthora idaei]